MMNALPIGYLVEKHNSVKKSLVLPSRKAEIILPIFLVMMYIGLVGGLGRKNKTKQILYFILEGMFAILSGSTMLLYNMFNAVQCYFTICLLQ